MTVFTVQDIKTKDTLYTLRDWLNFWSSFNKNTSFTVHFIKIIFYEMAFRSRKGRYEHSNFHIRKATMSAPSICFIHAILALLRISQYIVVNISYSLKSLFKWRSPAAVSGWYFINGNHNLWHIYLMDKHALFALSSLSSNAKSHFCTSTLESADHEAIWHE